jgi:serine phosphatase RsbU (regulator of sigma subunit)
MCEAVLHDLGHFRSTTPAADDVTLLVVRRR